MSQHEALDAQLLVLGPAAVVGLIGCAFRWQAGVLLGFVMTAIFLPIAAIEEIREGSRRTFDALARLLLVAASYGALGFLFGREVTIKIAMLSFMMTLGANYYELRRAFARLVGCRRRSTLTRRVK